MPRRQEEYSFREEETHTYQAVVSHTGTHRENWQAIHDMTDDFKDSQPLFDYVNELRDHLDHMGEQRSQDHSDNHLLKEAKEKVQEVWDNLYWTDRNGLDGAAWLSQADFHAAGDPRRLPGSHAQRRTLPDHHPTAPPGRHHHGISSKALKARTTTTAPRVPIPHDIQGYKTPPCNFQPSANW